MQLVIVTLVILRQKKLWPRMQPQSLVDRFSSYLQGRARDWIQQPSINFASEFSPLSV